MLKAQVKIRDRPLSRAIYSLIIYFAKVKLRLSPPYCFMLPVQVWASTSIAFYTFERFLGTFSGQHKPIFDEVSKIERQLNANHFNCCCVSSKTFCIVVKTLEYAYVMRFEQIIGTVLGCCLGSNLVGLCLCHE